MPVVRITRTSKVALSSQELVQNDELPGKTRTVLIPANHTSGLHKHPTSKASKQRLPSKAPDYNASDATNMALDQVIRFDKGMSDLNHTTPRPSANPPALPNPMSCTICGRLLHSTNTLQRHMQEIHGPKDVPCDVAGCRKAFGSDRAMQMHKQQMHGDPKKATPCNAPGCYVLLSGDRGSITKHMQIHAQEQSTTHPSSRLAITSPARDPSPTTAHAWLPAIISPHSSSQTQLAVPCPPRSSATSPSPRFKAPNQSRSSPFASHIPLRTSSPAAIQAPSPSPRPAQNQPCQPIRPSATVQRVTSKKLYHCSFTECDKVLKTSTGIQLHERRMHPTPPHASSLTANVSTGAKNVQFHADDVGRDMHVHPTLSASSYGMIPAFRFVPAHFALVPPSPQSPIDPQHLNGPTLPPVYQPTNHFHGVPNERAPTAEMGWESSSSLTTEYEEPLTPSLMSLLEEQPQIYPDSSYGNDSTNVYSASVEPIDFAVIQDGSLNEGYFPQFIAYDDLWQPDEMARR